MSDLQAAWGRLRRLDVQVLAVAVGDSAHDVRAFVAKTPIGFPLLLDTEKEAFGNWPAIAMPTTFLIGHGGRIVAKIVGPYEWNDPDHLRRLPLRHSAVAIWSAGERLRHARL